MSALPKSSWLLTVKEYFANEKVSDVRHEYVQGQVFARADVSRRHAEIVGNILGHIWNVLRGQRVRVLANTTKVPVTELIYYYPDIVVTSEASDPDSLFVEQPILVVEVLSPATTPTDQREKGYYFRQIPSLQCYLLVNEEERHVERYWRVDVDAEWHHEVVIGRSVPIPGIDLDLRLDDIYEGIEFEPQP